MGREVKRVPLGFDWPMNKIWKGFINPHHKPCPEAGRTCFNGENAAACYLAHLTSMFAVVATSALEGRTHPYCETLPYLGDHPDFSIQSKEVRERFVKLFQAISGDEKQPFMGFQGHALFFKLLELGGFKSEEDPDGKNPAYEWTHCLTCCGDNVDPAVKEKYDAWQDYEPPQGEGWQMWETTSEGSPISPVHATPEELAQWLANTEASAFGSEGATYEQWLTTIKRGWAPSAVGQVGVGIQSGVAGLADTKKRD